MGFYIFHLKLCCSNLYLLPSATEQRGQRWRYGNGQQRGGAMALGHCWRSRRHGAASKRIAAALMGHCVYHLWPYPLNKNNEHHLTPLTQHLEPLLLYRPKQEATFKALDTAGQTLSARALDTTTRALNTAGALPKQASSTD